MIPLQHGLILAGILFVLGLTGLTIRRNLLFMLISLEVMINAAALAFVVAGSYWGQPDGQVMYILAISLAAAAAGWSFTDDALRDYRGGFPDPRLCFMVHAW